MSTRTNVVEEPPCYLEYERDKCVRYVIGSVSFQKKTRDSLSPVCYPAKCQMSTKRVYELTRPGSFVRLVFCDSREPGHERCDGRRRLSMRYVRTRDGSNVRVPVPRDRRQNGTNVIRNETSPRRKKKEERTDDRQNTRRAARSPPSGARGEIVSVLSAAART